MYANAEWDLQVFSLVQSNHPRFFLDEPEGRTTLYAIKRRRANWIGYILRRNCLLKLVIEVKIEGRVEVTERRGRRRKKLLDDLEERRECWKLNEEALEATERLWTCRKTD